MCLTVFWGSNFGSWRAGKLFGDIWNFNSVVFDNMSESQGQTAVYRGTDPRASGHHLLAGKELWPCWRCLKHGRTWPWLVIMQIESSSGRYSVQWNLAETALLILMELLAKD